MCFALVCERTMPSRKLLSRPIRQRLHRVPGWFSRGKLSLPNVCRLSSSALLNSFRRPHLRAARPRIAINLFLPGGHWLLRQQLVVTLLRAFAEGIFHDAVLQRVETDDHYPSARFQHSRGRFQQLPQVVQFMVYEDSESLKGSASRDEFFFLPDSLAGPRLIPQLQVPQLYDIGRDRTMALAILRDLLSSPNS